MTNFTKTSALTALAFGLFSGAAMAGEDNFTPLDTDKSGGLSLAEVQAVAPNVTAETFAAYDADASSELSRDEFDAWMKASAEKTE